MLHIIPTLFTAGFRVDFPFLIFPSACPSAAASVTSPGCQDFGTLSAIRMSRHDRMRELHSESSCRCRPTCSLVHAHSFFSKGVNVSCYFSAFTIKFSFAMTSVDDDLKFYTLGLLRPVQICLRGILWELFYRLSLRIARAPFQPTLECTK